MAVPDDHQDADDEDEEDASQENSIDDLDVGGDRDNVDGDHVDGDPIDVQPHLQNNDNETTQVKYLFYSGGLFVSIVQTGYFYPGRGSVI